MLTKKETTDVIFNDLENQLLDRREIDICFEKISFVSVYFLERLEKLIDKAKELNVKIQITDVKPSIYKVFQVGRVKSILEVCQ